MFIVHVSLNIFMSIGQNVLWITSSSSLVTVLALVGIIFVFLFSKNVMKYI